jgi:phosphomethylpyrimidine synthase
MTQLEQAKKNNTTPQMKQVARDEGSPLQLLRAKINQGKVVIPYNKRHRPKRVCGIGEGLSTKVNANIGTSGDYSSVKNEITKMKISVSAGAHAVMDLSTGGNIARIRKEILEHCPVPLGTVPVYEAAVNAVRKKGAIAKMQEGDLLKTIEGHAKDGVDFFTLHCGVTKESLRRLRREKRTTDIVSRGGAILVEWMSKNKKENPLYTYFDRILDIAKRYDVTISLGDGMRPGSIADATDRTQVQELVLLGELAQRARDEGVQVMIEGPGHVPLNQIQANVQLEKRLCHDAPFYVLGPLVTDVAPGYDHITAAIGGAHAASYGADFLCYVTASEHLRLPTIKDVREAVIVARIAAHAGDVAKGLKPAIEWDAQISRARKRRDWKKQIKLAIDPVQPEKLRRKFKSSATDVCSMCAQYCSLKLMDQMK